jgi:hypothetical protein
LEEFGVKGSRFCMQSHIRTSASSSKIIIFDTKRGQLYVCDGVRAAFWRGIAQGESMTSIAENAAAAYGRPEEEVSADLQEFIKELSALHLLAAQRSVEQARATWLLIAALWELVIYDMKIRLFGFQQVYHTIQRKAWNNIRSLHNNEQTAAIVAAVTKATSLYWRPVKCLQRSIATTRLLRSSGIPAELVIGYRMQPFLSHAWVEVGGQVVNDSQALAQRLTVLDRV